MIRLSRIIKDLKEARCKLNSAISQTDYYIINGESSDLIRDKVNKCIADCLYLEQYLHSSVSKSCDYLDGFKPKKMEPIDYISSSDVKNKFVDICLGKKVTAVANLTTGEISEVEPEYNDD